MSLSRLFLLPFALLYGVCTTIRNLLYDWGWYSSTSSNLPVISVGNLSVGGTGKTPHIEYLIRLLSAKFRVATLSRGYGRKSKGFIRGDQFSDTTQIGDEPLQYVQKFENIVVTVDEKRVRGINEIAFRYPSVDVILMDDGFQHRAVKPGLSILLTDYFNLYREDYLLPVGTLRERIAGAARADIIVVTKCPEILSPLTRQRINSLLKPLPHQKLYFSYIRYGNLTPLFPNACLSKRNKKINTILLFAGIANTYPLEEYLRRNCIELIAMTYPDHHQYTAADLAKIRLTWEQIHLKSKLLITTEKDAMRLKFSPVQDLVVHLPVQYLPIEVVFHADDEEAFNRQVSNYVERGKSHR